MKNMVKNTQSWLHIYLRTIISENISLIPKNWLELHFYMHPYFPPIILIPFQFILPSQHLFPSLNLLRLPENMIHIFNILLYLPIVENVFGTLFNYTHIDRCTDANDTIHSVPSQSYNSLPPKFMQIWLDYIQNRGWISVPSWVGPSPIPPDLIHHNVCFSILEKGHSIQNQGSDH